MSKTQIVKYTGKNTNGKIMAGTKDNINQLIEEIESQKFNYVLGIIRPGENTDELEITTNIKNEPISQLIKILREHQKTVKIKSNGNKEK